jgi:hypothetical protein
VATVSVSWEQALAWRMKRHLLDPIGTSSIREVVRQLCGVQTQVASSAELAVRVRRQTSRAGEVATALSKGDLIKTWAMRGTLHLLTPEDGAAFLSLMASGRSWERPSWQRYFGVDPAGIERLREAVREVLDDAVLTREELVEAVTARPGLETLGEALRSGWGTLLKPIAWQGDLCFGPSRGNRVTFTTPNAASRGWAGVPEADEAAPLAIAAYLGAYGPATSDAFGNWLAGGYFGKRQLRAWFAALGERLAEVDVEGEHAYVLVEHLDELASTEPTKTLRLLPGFDQWVLGPGTSDPHVVPARRRAEVSKQSGWIAPVVVRGGLVSGTWDLDGDVARVAWFKESGRMPRSVLAAEVERLAAIVARPLSLDATLA